MLGIDNNGHRRKNKMSMRGTIASTINSMNYKRLKTNVGFGYIWLTFLNIYLVNVSKCLNVVKNMIHVNINSWSMRTLHV